MRSGIKPLHYLTSYFMAHISEWTCPWCRIKLEKFKSIKNPEVKIGKNPSLHHKDNLVQHKTREKQKEANIDLRLIA